MRARRKDWEPVEVMFNRLSVPDPNTGCHIWQGKIGTGGYAYISYRENGERLHRKAATIALELAGRPRSDGLEVSHVCPNGENRACVNSDHLLWETHAENLARREWSPKGQRYVVNCKDCGVAKQRTSWTHAEWTCRECNARRAKKWREKTGYDFNAYRAANRDRINARRRELRQGRKP